MAKRIFANVKPQILVWARNSAGLSVEAAAVAMKVQAELVEKWESDDDTRPSIPQLRKLAALYKRPLAAFYLQEVPLQFKVLSDLRRLTPGVDRTYSPALVHEIRVAHQRRELALEMRKDLDESAESFGLRLGNLPPEEAGEEIRKFLNISDEAIRRFNSDSAGRLGLNTWRNAIEQSGVLVFQSNKIPQSEASGFALAYETLPVAVINRKDIPQRRLFSLLHEFAHILLREDGVSDMKFDMSQIDSSDIELRCNAIAAAALMPKSILAPELENAYFINGEITDESIIKLARRFGVSRPALLIRLIELGRANWNFYFRKTSEYADEYERAKELRKPAGEIKRNIPQESLSDLGRPFIGLVFSNYYNRHLTLSDVAGYLGIRVKHVEALQRRLAV